MGVPLLKYSISAYSTTSDRVNIFHIPSPRGCHLLGPRPYTFSVVTSAFGTISPLRSFHMDKAYVSYKQRSIWQPINSPIGKQLWDCRKGYFASNTGQEIGWELFSTTSFPSELSLHCFYHYWIFRAVEENSCLSFSDAKHTFLKRRSSLNFVKCMPSYNIAFTPKLLH